MSTQNPNPDPYEQQPYGASSSASTPYDPAAPGYDPAAPGGAVPPPPPGYPVDPSAAGVPPGMGAPNPMLAALLGFIPGVGAMYNGQFAKGIAHIAIFAVFSSLSSHVSDFFGLFVAGWIFYMVFEAYHTARARREGLPLPDPFGFNNIGERFGFHGNPDWNSFWHPGAHPPAGEPPVGADPGAYYPRTDPAGHTTWSVDPSGNVARPAQPGAGYVPPAPGYVPPVPPYGAAGYGASYGPPTYGAPAYGVPPAPPPPPPFTAPPMPTPPMRRRGLPTGAIWLIGLGFFALLGSLHSFAWLQGEATGGLFLIALSAFIFWKRYNATAGMFPEGSPAAKWNAVHASRGAGVVFIVGLLTLLQGLHVVAWEQSWPFLLIFLGVGMLIQRNAMSSMSTANYPAYPASPVPPPSPAATETASGTSIVPKYTRPENDLNNHEEGR